MPIILKKLSFYKVSRDRKRTVSEKEKVPKYSVDAPEHLLDPIIAF